MTKKRKIKLLVNDNKRLTAENKKLHQLNNEEISKKMMAEMDRYSDVIDKLYEEYKKLDKLRLVRLRNCWKYRLMLWRIKARQRVYRMIKKRP